MMKPITDFWADSLSVSTKIFRVFQKRAQLAFERFNERWRKAMDANPAPPEMTPLSFWKNWIEGRDYMIDLLQRSVLFWDTMRERGDNFLAQRESRRPSFRVRNRPRCTTI